MPADVDGFRRFMGLFPQGVTIITVRAGDIEHGMTATSVTSLSMEPLLFLICVDRTSRAHPLVESARRFVVNLLARDQADIVRPFANKDLSDDERWSLVTVHRGRSGVPRIDGCVAYLECTVADSFPGGTHTIYLGAVEDVADGSRKPPLVWHAGAARDLAAG